VKSRVLLVDDDTEFTELIAFNLALDGCEICIAHDGIDGLRLARVESPDVILLDLLLPDMGGLSVCEILQNQPSTRDIPVFIVSALDHSWVETNRSKARFARFFRKPVDLKLLSADVFSACKQRQETIRSRLAGPPD
jgi:DNA-binding response OmpR family regulator